VAAALGLTHSGGGGIPGFQKPGNPFLHHIAATPDGGTSGRSLPAAGAILRRTDVTVPAVTASVPPGLASLLTPSPLRATSEPRPSVSPSSYPGPAPSASPSGSASPSPSASPSSYPSPAPSATHSGSASPSPSASSPSAY
jgi:hypothetical protein